MSETSGSGPHADWSQVGAAFTALGDRIQAHFSHLTGKAEASQPSQTQPFEDLGRSLDAALQSFRDAVNDPSISDAAKSAADRLMAALKMEVDSAASTVGDVATSVTDAASSVTDAASGAVAQLPSSDTPDETTPGAPSQQ